MGIKSLPHVKRFMFMILAVLIPSITFAQSYVLNGVVTDENGAPLAGTTIIKQGTADGTITGAEGSFELEVSQGEVLTFSFIGYLDQNITVAGQTTLNVQMQADANAMDDVVVVGYGRMRKADVTAAITSVDVDELKSVATSDPMAALQGRVSGVSILGSSGLAGGSASVKIRGVSTFGSTEPLYIIDGFPGSISSVSPSNIESLQILKDGAAAAIYGSEAANGVVIITTKSGKSGEIVIDFNAYVSMRNVANQFDLLDAKGYKQVQTQLHENAGETLPNYVTSPSTVDTDWTDEVFRTGFSQNYGVSVSGGTENITVAATANFTDDKGVAIGNSYKRQDASIKTQMKKHIFTFDAKLSYMDYDRTVPQYSLKDVYVQSPLVPVYFDANHTNVTESTYGLSGNYGTFAANNPIADYENRSELREGSRISASAAITLDFTDWLSFRSGYSYSQDQFKESYHVSPYVGNVTAPTIYASNYDERRATEEQTLTNALTFDKQFGKHSLNVMLGMQMDMRNYNESKVNVEGKSSSYFVDSNGNVDVKDVPGGFADGSFTTINAGKGGTYTGEGFYNRNNRESYFGRFNYNYDNRYLVQATIRRDASSLFGENNRWGTFPSVALGWRITQEEFFPRDTEVNELKLRASWGQLGNESRLEPYYFESLMSVGNNWGSSYLQGGNPWVSSYYKELENKDLRWETSESLNIGLDYAFYDNRLSGSFNYYSTTTRDLLIYNAIPVSAGFENPLMNIGTVRNSGFEFEARWADTKGDWSYNVGLIVSTTKNEVLALGDLGSPIVGWGIHYGTSHFPTLTAVGGPIGAYHLLTTDGIFQDDAAIAAHSKDGELIQPNAKPGDIKFVDKNNDGKIDDDDKEEMGSGIPKAEVSISLGFGWKGIDFSALIGSGWGHDLYNGNRFLHEDMASAANMLTTTLDAWTPQNTGTTVPRAVLENPNGNAEPSDRFLESGDFIRLRQIQLGYTLPASVTNKISIDRVRFYISAENPLTWTNYSGVDPEFSAALLDTGVDTTIFPFTTSYVLGVQVTF